jgi:SIR2-like domain
MPIIDLKTAVAYIRVACDDAIARNERSPFFFLVGAGISTPSIPSAGDLVELCKSHYAELRMQIPGFREPSPPHGTSLANSYSYWLNLAYREPVQRRNFLRSQVEGARITNANLRLAHLVSSKRLSSMVITSNFDDLLSRALDLFGYPRVVCDHPKTTLRIDPDCADIQIVHVHGSYMFYDLRNLEYEIEQTRNEGTLASMPSLLRQVLIHRSPIVVGYGGWAGDTIMTILKERLDEGLEHNSYWFCHSREAYDSLPSYFRDHNEILFVLPGYETDPALIAVETKIELTKISQTIQDPSKVLQPHYLDAVDVFDALIEAFRLEAPALTKDPIGFFGSQLKRAVHQTGSGQPKASTDLYNFGSIIKRIASAKRLEARDRSDSAKTLEGIRDAMRRADYARVVKLAILAKRLQAILSNSSAVEEIITSLEASINRVSLDNDVRERGFSSLVALVRRLKSGKQHEYQVNFARAMRGQAGALADLNKPGRAIGILKELINRFRGSNNASVRRELLSATVDIGTFLSVFEKKQAGIDLLAKFAVDNDKAKDTFIGNLVARSMYMRGIGLLVMDRELDAFEELGRVIDLFRDSEEPAKRDYVANATRYRAILSHSVKASSEQLTQVLVDIKSFIGSKEYQARNSAAHGAEAVGSIRFIRNDRFGAAEAYRVVSELLPDAVGADNEFVAKAMAEEVSMYRAVNDQEAERLAVERLTRRYGASSDPAIQRIVASINPEPKSDAPSELVQQLMNSTSSPEKPDTTSNTTE